MDDHAFKEILCFFGLSFRGYRKVRKGVKKRLVRHMNALGCSTVQSYLDHITAHPLDLYQCRLCLTVSISRFFRDLLVWETITSRVLPVFEASGQSKIRIWSAGCARGEEAWSMRMIWEKAKTEGLNLPPLHLLATDIHPLYLEAAQSGSYGRTSVKEVNSADRTAFFDIQKGGRRFVVKPLLKPGVTFQRLDLCTELPDHRFDLIFMRNNILTYLEDPQRSEVFARVLAQLRPSGYFVKGAHETIPETSHSLERVCGGVNVFQNL